MMELILMALAFLLGGFGVELFLLHLTKSTWKWLRALPLLAVAGLWLYGWYMFKQPSMFGNLSDLEGLAALIAGTLILLGCGLAWLVFHRMKL